MASAPGRGSGAAEVSERLSRTVVAVRRHAAAASAQIIVRIAVVDRFRRIDVPVQALVEAVLPRNRVHVRLIIEISRVVVMLPARISRCPTGMAPANADVIL